MNKADNISQRLIGRQILKINKIQDQNQLGPIRYNIRLIKIFKIIFFKEYRQALDFLNKDNRLKNRKLIFRQPF